MSCHLGPAIHFCPVLLTLTSPNFQPVENQLVLVTKSPPFISVPLLCSFYWIPVKFRVEFRICLLIYKTLHEKQPFYLDAMLATSLPSHSPISNQEVTLSVSRVKINTGARAFCCRAPSLRNYPSVWPPRLKPSGNVSKHVSLTWLCPQSPFIADGPLMLRNCFIDFAVEHQFSCCAREPGYAGDTGAIEI